MEQNKYPHGALPDPRSEAEKAIDYKHEHHFIGGMVQWAATPKALWKRYKQRFQSSSFSCCMQSAAKAGETITGTILSAIEYQWRTPHQPGMFLKNVGDIAYNKGITTEVLAPSQNMSDSQIDAAKIPNTNFFAVGYRTFIDQRNIESIAQAIETYKHCLLTFESNEDEWDAPNQTPVYKGTAVTFGHCICAVDYILVNGIKTLVCEDSSGQWSSPDGLRLITENFLKNRCTGALYFLGINDTTSKPVDPQKPVTETIVTKDAQIHTTAIQAFWEAFKAGLRRLGIPFTESKE